MGFEPYKLKTAIGSNYSGASLKEGIVRYLKQLEIDVVDLGTDKEDEDYLAIADRVSKAVLKGECTFGILLHETGVGMSIAANKIDGIRACICNDVYIAEIARKEQNCNILVMGSKIVGRDLALRIVDAWIGKS